jgi:2-methylisocitrate lyase-like PEP mutase family enzyme
MNPASMSPGARFRAALKEEKPLQIIGAINANHALMAKQAGYRAIYLSGGGVAAGSLGMPDLGINTLDDVLTDVRRITDVCDVPLLVDIDTGFGPSAFNIARTIKSLCKMGAAAVHIEDQVGAKRCGHRPGKEIVTTDEMADRVKAAADAKTDGDFFIIARTDAIASEGVDRAIERSVACVEAGADAIFAEAANDLDTYRKFAAAVKAPSSRQHHRVRRHAAVHCRRTAQRQRGHGAVPAVGVPRDEQGGVECLSEHSPRRHPEGRARHDADAHGVVRRHRLPRVRAASGRSVRTQEVTLAVHKDKTDPGERSMNDTAAPAGAPKVKKSVALSGVVAGNTALCTVGRTGNDLAYRGYDILDVATTCEFEEIAHLLVHGKLPTVAELRGYKAKLKSLRGLPASVKAALETLPAASHPMDVMRTGVSALGCALPEKDDHATPGARDIADRLMASIGLDAALLVPLCHQRQAHRCRDR